MRLGIGKSDGYLGGILRGPTEEPAQEARAGGRQVFESWKGDVGTGD